MKRKEAKQGECAKCGKYFYVHTHHIEPKALHEGDGETADLCPNCHTHIHEYMNKHVRNMKDKEEIWRIWEEWINRVPVTWVLVVGLLSALWWMSG